MGINMRIVNLCKLSVIALVPSIIVLQAVENINFLGRELICAVVVMAFICTAVVGEDLGKRAS